MKIYSLAQCSLTVSECDWHIMAGNDERINSHCLTRYTTKVTALRTTGIPSNHGFSMYISYHGPKYSSTIDTSW